ncbi:MAG: electron transport complex subunit RsxC [Candidatus Eisenbacteria bacterium]
MSHAPGLTPPPSTFGRGGVHPDPHKEATSGRAIERVDPPSEVVLPLQQHLGEPATPLVKKGELVRRGQKIADGGATGVPLHASISGKIRPFDKRPHPTLGIAPAIAIVADAAAGPELEYTLDATWTSLPREEALARIRDAGIVGLGGAAFPTWRKLESAAKAAVDTLVLNGAECEPYLTSDHRLMLAWPCEIVEGALALARVTGAMRVVIGVESDKPDAIAALRAAAGQVWTGAIEVKIAPCVARYPQGAERQLVHATTGRTVPPRQLPAAVGVLVQNVATALAVRDALREQRPLLDRVVTVTGPGVKQPRNLVAPLGTALTALVEACGGMVGDARRLVAGGPMMGRTLPRLDVPLVKGMNGLVVLTGKGPLEDGYDACIRCARCLDACPLGLEPDQVSVRVEAGRTLDTERYGALDCYECGCCSYVCPSGRPLVQFMQVAKGALRRAAEIGARR